jgi:hypothetical protein
MRRLTRTACSGAAVDGAFQLQRKGKSPETCVMAVSLTLAYGGCCKVQIQAARGRRVRCCTPACILAIPHPHMPPPVSHTITVSTHLLHLRLSVL